MRREIKADMAAIRKLLADIFPQNPELAEQWLTRPNLAFDRATPKQIIDTEPDGLRRVLKYLLDQIGR